MEHLSYDVVIAGGGIVGSACALELVQAGLRVAVIEPRLIGGGATAAGMGHLAVMDDTPEQFALTRHSQLLWQKLAHELPDDVEYLPCGSLWIAADEIEMAEVERKFAYYQKRGVPVEILDAQMLGEAEPNLRPGLAGALLMSDDAVVYSPNAARFLAQKAMASGAAFVLQRTVMEFRAHEALLDDGRRFRAQWMVVANGTDAVKLVPGLQMKPRKGHLVITDRYPGFVQHQLIELGYLKSAHAIQSDSVAFNVQPRRTGQLLIGSSRQYGSSNSPVEQSILSRMMTRALEFMPGLGNLQVLRAWTGLRAATPDKLPLIGPHPDEPSVYLATGHEGLGISTSLATAQILTDQLVGRSPSIDAEPYRPSRVMLHA